MQGMSPQLLVGDQGKGISCPWKAYASLFKNVFYHSALAFALLLNSSWEI